MKLHLERLQCENDLTIGSLTIDGDWVCWTLEDAVRQEKVPGETAIPFGKYPVVITWSPKFKRELPLLQHVPNFTGIRIHAGNTAADTEGCILVGLDRHQNSIGRSRLAFDAVFQALSHAVRKLDTITIEITT